MDFVFNTTIPAGVSEEDHNNTFVDLIVLMGNSIYGETLCVDGDTLVVGENVLRLIKSIGVFDESGTGTNYVGKLRDKWLVYYVPQFDSDAFELIVNGVNRPEQFALSRLRRSGRII